MKKGFTLVELLATIVILGVIAVITIPIVGKIIDNNKFKSASLSALGYIEAANVYAAKFNDGILVNDEKFIYESYADEDALSKIKYAGVSPTYVKLEYDIDNKTVIDANMCIQNYNLVYHAGEVSKAAFDYCHNSDSILPIVNAYLDLNVAIIEITDEGSGVKAYCVTQTNKNDCTWQDTSGYHIEYEFETVGTYYIYGIDKAKNVSLPFELTLTENDFCPYNAGKYWEFAYKGSIDEFEVPCKGLYKLEVWGAAGAYYGGAGGYSIGHKVFAKDEKLYIVAGGVGGSTSYTNRGSGGYNGGGYSYGQEKDGKGHGGGGGATHIAKVTGTLTTIGYNSFVTQGNGLIVAGGGGGGYNDVGSVRGGSAGGGSSNLNSTFGKGTDAGSTWTGGGGGGFYGGNKGSYYNGSYGGSSWVGGVPEIEYKGTTYTPSTTVGGNSGNGKAKITLIEY